MASIGINGVRTEVYDIQQKGRVNQWILLRLMEIILSQSSLH